MSGPVCATHRRRPGQSRLRGQRRAGRPGQQGTRPGAAGPARDSAEAGLLAAAAGCSPLPVPEPGFTDREHGRKAYAKIPGVPLLASAAAPAGRSQSDRLPNRQNPHRRYGTATKPGSAPEQPVRRGTDPASAGRYRRADRRRCAHVAGNDLRRSVTDAGNCRSWLSSGDGALRAWRCPKPPVSPWSARALDDSGFARRHEPRCSVQYDSFVARVRYERFADRVERGGDLVGRGIGHETARDVG